MLGSTFFTRNSSTESSVTNSWNTKLFHYLNKGDAKACPISESCEMVANTMASYLKQARESICSTVTNGARKMSQADIITNMTSSDRKRSYQEKRRHKMEYYTSTNKFSVPKVSAIENNTLLQKKQTTSGTRPYAASVSSTGTNTAKLTNAGGISRSVSDSTCLRLTEVQVVKPNEQDRRQSDSKAPNALQPQTGRLTRGKGKRFPSAADVLDKGLIAPKVFARSYSDVSHRLAGYDPCSIPGIMPLQLDTSPSKFLLKNLEQKHQMPIDNPLSNTLQSDNDSTENTCCTSPLLTKPTIDVINEETITETMSDFGETDFTTLEPKSGEKRHSYVPESEQYFRNSPHIKRKFCSTLKQKHDPALDYADIKSLAMRETALNKHCFGTLNMSVHFRFLEEKLRIRIKSMNVNKDFSINDSRFYVTVSVKPKLRTSSWRSRTRTGKDQVHINDTLTLSRVTFDVLHLVCLHVEVFQKTSWFASSVRVADCRVFLDNLDVIGVADVSQKLTYLGK